jgi:hypothetical protein
MNNDAMFTITTINNIFLSISVQRTSTRIHSPRSSTLVVIYLKTSIIIRTVQQIYWDTQPGGSHDNIEQISSYNNLDSSLHKKCYYKQAE